MPSLASACMIRAEPNMEPRAVERQAVAIPSTTKYGEAAHASCITLRLYCRAPRSRVPACPSMRRM